MSISKLATITLTMSLFLVSGCGTEPAAESPSSTGCSSGSAEIAVYDNDSRILCGCQESAGRVAPGDNLKCTVSKDTVVFIHFLGTTNNHSLAPTGTPVFPSSPAVDLTAPTPVRVHAVKLTDSGTYGFTDLHNSTIHGQVVVR